VVAVLALAVAAGSGEAAGASTLRSGSRAAHRCTPGNTIIQCTLTGPPLAAPASAPPAVGGYGVDFAYSCPEDSAKNFGASYLSPTISKNWTRRCVNQFHAAGKATVAVFEAGGCDATGSYALGYADAKLAARQLARLGAPRHQPFDMAVDCNVAGSRLVSYFRGADAAEHGRINAFGGYYTILYLYKRRLVGHLNWQTYGWSAGHWLSASIAPLEQYDNHYYLDDDRAIAIDYGQWPAPRPGAFRYADRPGPGAWAARSSACRRSSGRGERTSTGSPVTGCGKTSR
jgi:hypothetical protein